MVSLSSVAASAAEAQSCAPCAYVKRRKSVDRNRCSARYVFKYSVSAPAPTNTALLILDEAQVQSSWNGEQEVRARAAAQRVQGLRRQRHLRARAAAHERSDCKTAAVK